MNQYPLWKYLLLVVVITVGLLYSSPNLYGEDPAVQVSAERGAVFDETLDNRIRNTLTAAGITPKSLVREQGRVLVRFESGDDQLKGADALRAELARGYIVALNLAPTTPDWMGDIGALPMYLGLDLRGGVHFLMEVDMEAAVKNAMERYVGDIRSQLREEKIRYRSVQLRPEGLNVTFRSEGDVEVGRSRIRTENPDLELIDGAAGSNSIIANLSEAAVRETKRFALQQNITTLRKRVNELGVAEPVIQQQGDNRIVVQLPGVQDTARAKEILGATATLEFRLADDEHSVQQAVASGRAPIGTKLYFERNGAPILLKRQLIISGDYIVDAASGIDSQSGSPNVTIMLDGRGANIMSDRTKDNIGRRMAVVFIEQKSETVVENGEEVRKRRITQDVINVAVIRDRLGKRFQITGLDSTEESRDLALLLRAGALAAPIDIIEERTIGPSLGQESIDQGTLSVQIGFALVLIFMFVYYRVFGLVADIALAVNLILIMAVLSMLQATLTLPGIAGIVLTVGMAVDANVLIFERIREELRNGNSPQNSIKRGYEQAFATIADANITTFIAALVLFLFGTGPIKGFAVTLSIGILTSMFTAIMGTRAIINLVVGGRSVQKLYIGWQRS
ncbi:MAG: protein translocase subunit SecD [Gammaproteobacteria bacterium]